MRIYTRGIRVTQATYLKELWYRSAEVGARPVAADLFIRSILLEDEALQNFMLFSTNSSLTRCTARAAGQEMPSRGVRSRRGKRQRFCGRFRSTV